MSDQASPSIINHENVLYRLKNYRETLNALGVKTLALFGSAARNEATETSDLDFLVEFDTELTFDLYMDLKFFLEDLFDKNVDLVIKTDLKPQIREAVINEAIYVSQP